MAREKILVIDDSPLVRKLAEVSLQEAEYEVYTASDGEEGLKIAETIKPDLILVDFIMPKITGLQFCKLIRDNETLKDIPIILITGKGEKVGEDVIEKYKILDYFIKPFKSEDLIKKVTTSLSKVSETTVETTIETSQPISEIDIQELEHLGSTLQSPDIEEISFLEQKDSIQLQEQKEIPDEVIFEETQEFEKEQEFAKEIDLGERIEILNQAELEIAETIEEIPEITESKSTEEFLFDEEVVKSEIDKMRDIDKIQNIVDETQNKDNISAYSLEKLIDDKLNSLYQRIPTIFEASVEGILKKYGLIKDSSHVLSGNLKFFKLSEIFSLLNSNRLSGIFTVYSKSEIYEFLFIDGFIVYGISNIQREKLGFNFLNEISQEQIKNITIETIRTLNKSEIENFVFEKRDFDEEWLLTKEHYNPSELF